MATHSSILAWITHEESHVYNTLYLIAKSKGCLSFPIISYCITELLLKVSMLASGDLRAPGETEAMRIREEERW